MDEWYVKGDEASRTDAQHTFKCMSTEAASMASAAEQSSGAPRRSELSASLERDYRELHMKVQMMKRDLVRAEKKRLAQAKLFDDLEELCRKYPERSQKNTLVEAIISLIGNESSD